MVVNFFGSNELAYNFEAMKEDALKRAEDFQNEKERIGKIFHLFPRIWKAIGEVASTGDYSVYREKITEQEASNPTTIRHLTRLKKAETLVSPEEVEIGVGDTACRLSSHRCLSDHKTRLRFALMQKVPTA